MEITKILGIVKKIGIKFRSYEDALESKESSVVLKNGLPRGIYIPFGDIPRLIAIVKEIWEELKKTERKT